MTPQGSDPSHDDVARAVIRAKARRLIATAGLGWQDQADVEQSLAAALVKRWPRFDPARGCWPGFVRVVVAHAATDLLRARRAKKRPPAALPSLEALAGERHEELAAPDRRASGDLDTAELLARLPAELRELAGLLQETTLAAAARGLGVPRHRLVARLRRLRAYFECAALRDYL